MSRITKGRQSHRQRSIPQYMPGLKEALEKAWPSGIVEVVDRKESYLAEILPRLTRGLAKLKKTKPLYERSAKGEPIGELPVDERGPSASYHFYFVSPAGSMFEYSTEAEEVIGEFEFDEEELEHTPLNELEELPTRTIPGKGWYGWAVGVSYVAPYAEASLQSRVMYDDGSKAEPELQCYAENEEGSLIPTRDAVLAGPEGAKAVEALDRLLMEIQKVLEQHGIVIIPEDECRKLVPWLRPGDEVFLGFMDKSLAVRDAFFFQLH
jgi:hypothetical protein